MFNIVTPENDENYALFERYLARSFSFAVTGLTTLLRLLLVTKIRKITDKKVLLITATEQNALKYQNDFFKAFGIKSEILPFQNISMYESVSPNRYDYAEQVRILTEKPDIVIAPVKALLEKFPTENFYKNNLLSLIVTTEVWILIYNIFLSLYNNKPFDTYSLIKEMLFLQKVPLMNMWYMPIIIGIYIAIPYVSKVVHTFSIKTLKIPIILVFVCIFIMPTLNLILKTFKLDQYNCILDISFLGGGYGLYIVGGYLIREKIIKKINIIHKNITNGEEQIELEYITECDNKEKYLQLLKERRKLDIIKGFTTKGIHRDDFLIYINGKETSVYGSQGQNRTAMLSLKLSELNVVYDEIGEYPILLLDDFMSELDRTRRKNFLENIEGTQVIITGTEKLDIENLKYLEYNVSNGKVLK